MVGREKEEKKNERRARMNKEEGDGQRGKERVGWRSKKERERGRINDWNSRR